MKRRLTTALLLVLLLGCCGDWALLWRDYTSHRRDLDGLRVEVSRLRENPAPEARADVDELELLRRNHVELGDLAVKLRGLRETRARQEAASKASADEVNQLQGENAQLRNRVDQLKRAPATAEARRSVDETQLAQIGQYFRAYARNNGGKFPPDFAELRYYLPANVYQTIETDRFEILTSADGTSVPGQEAIVRTRFADGQNTRSYLFADGHVETRGAP
jgi:prepilin-type processing-associated H-X9-DG protein